MKILFVLSRVPWPLEKGDKLRAYHMARTLAEKHEVLLFCLADERVHPDAETQLRSFASEVFIYRLPWWGRMLRLARAMFTREPFQVEYFSSRSAIKAFHRFVELHTPQHFYCLLVRCVPFVERYRSISKTLDYMDALSAGMKLMARSSSWFMQPIMRWEAHKLHSYEQKVYPLFDNHIVISQQDAQRLDLPGPVTVVPNGISPLFLVNRRSTDRETRKTYDLLFTGNMSYLPNIASARYIVHNILPLLLKEHPSVRIAIAGANPAPAVQRLEGKNVTVTGWVDDLKQMYQSALIFVAPMLVNTGLQNKLLEAMALGLPCITTTMANNALGAQPGVEILVADSPEEYASHISSLIKNAELRDQIGLAGRNFVTRHFSWEGAANKLIHNIEQG